MTFRGSILIPLTAVAMLIAAPSATAQARLPDADHSTGQLTVADCLSRPEPDVQLCLMQIPSLRGYSRVPAEAPGH